MRTPAYENESTKSFGLMMTCNGCDRIIYDDEIDSKLYTEQHGYCCECFDNMQKGGVIL